VHWSWGAHSAMAEAEIEYDEKTSTAIDVRFRPRERDAFLAAFNVQSDLEVSVVIWTTTPWTIPGNLAVAVNPELSYALVETTLNNGAELIMLAEDMVSTVMARYGTDTFKVVGTASGQSLERQVLKHPLYDRDSLMVLGDYVTIESGTGCVHTAPDHGVDDFYTGKKYGLELLNSVDDNGVYNSWVEQFCWRTKTPIIFRATPQWLVSMDNNNLRQDASRLVYLQATLLGCTHYAVYSQRVGRTAPEYSRLD